MLFHTIELPVRWVLTCEHILCVNTAGELRESKSLECPWALGPHLSGPVLHPIPKLPPDRDPTCWD